MAVPIVPWTDHIIFVGEAIEGAPVIVKGRMRGYALIGCAESGDGNGDGGSGLDAEQAVQQFESQKK